MDKLIFWKKVSNTSGVLIAILFITLTYFDEYIKKIEIIIVILSILMIFIFVFSEIMKFFIKKNL